ncbi:MAG TPA: ABC transporter permease [Planctomycetota bacterium]|nr:ABC transporter permease [Planctomycetota bacterium]
MRWSVVHAVARATMRDFWRTPEAVFWSYAFPLGMALVLGFAFREQVRTPVPIAAVAAEDGTDTIAVLREAPRLQVEVLEPEAAERALTLGQVALIVHAGEDPLRLELDQTRPEAELAELLVRDRLQRGAGRRDAIPVATTAVTRPGSRYIDFLIPGLVGLNLLGMGMFGVGFNLVYMRVRRTLRRLAVTPMGRAEFFTGFILMRLVLALPASLVVVWFGQLVFGVPMRGNWAWLTALIVAGGVCFSGIGTLLGSRAKTIEGASGWLNLVQLPMWLLGGVFFSNQRFPGALQTVVDAIPMSILTDGLRGVMLEAEDLGAIAGPVLALLGLGVVCLAVAIRVFRWN